MTGSLDTVDVAWMVGGLAHLVHSAGAPVTPERGGRLAAAIDLAHPATPDELYWLARVTLVSTPGDIEIFDRVFRQVFGGLWDPASFRGDSGTPPPVNIRRGESHKDPRSGDRPHQPTSTPSPSLPGDRPDPDDTGDDDAAESILATMSRDERLRHQEFASMTSEELVGLREMMSRLELAPPPRRSRRTVRHRSGPAIDLRATLQHSLRSGGDPIELVHRRRRHRPRRLVLLCDISGSMEPYARAYLQLLHSAVGGADAEAFVFATRLTRITKVLQGTNPDHALFRAGLAAPDWSGGTRIGLAIKSFNDRFGRRGIARNAVVVVVSDGWERDDPALLGVEMERLGRLAHRVIWVNPRKAGKHYQPSVGGMAAALPHIDGFVSGHTLEAIDELLAEIAIP